MNVKTIKLSILDNITTFGDLIKLDIGRNNISERYFKHKLPKPYEVEMAIIEIEDAITSVQSLWINLVKNQSIKLILSKFQFADLIKLAGIQNILTAQQLELVFNRLVDIISGSPKQKNEFTDKTDFISSTLILRELMHHLQIEQIELVDE